MGSGEGERKTALKIASAILAVAVVVNFLAFIFGWIKPLNFWILTILFAVTAYVVLPRMRK